MFYFFTQLLAAMRRLGVEQNGLWRYAGVRWWGAWAASFPLMCCAMFVLGGPPAGFDRWPADAQAACGAGFGMVYNLAFAAWLAQIARPVRWVEAEKLRRGLLLVVGLIIASQLLPATRRAGVTIAALLQLPAPGVARVLTEILGTAFWPLVIGLAPVAYVALREQAIGNEALRRWFTTGRGADNGFAGYHEMKRCSQPLQETLYDPQD